MSTTKKQWVKPELIVLSRGKPEEAVLTLLICKGPGHPGKNGTGSGPCTNGSESCLACNNSVFS
jgi:hypothetical protein